MSTIVRFCAFALAFVFFCAPLSHAAASEDALTFGRAGTQATATLLDVFYAGNGAWRSCNQPDCRAATSDWGVDSATDALYLRWRQTHDPQIRATMASLLAAAPRYPVCGPQGCSTWSDTPEWDAVAFMREYDVLGDPQALRYAQAAYAFVEDSGKFALGACPSIRYQHPQPSPVQVKTLETEANAIKAAILLYQATQNRAYLDSAVTRYTAARTYFLDADLPLYTVHVLDDGTACMQQPHRFFASVNGDMIWNGIELARITGDQQYYDQALATAEAVDADLSDDRGIFANVQGENDVAEPLVEAMTLLAMQEHVQFAHAWILRNAAAALSARASDGTFSRFFDGPAQLKTSIWESNGGLALEIAAAELDPYAEAPDDGAWSGGRYAGTTLTTLPATITIDGSGVALIGTIGKSCQKHHLRVLVDGEATVDRTGLWQNHSMPGGDSVFFAWRWKTPGVHTITLEPSDAAIAVGEHIHLDPYVVR